jgi:hypothetical protein
MIPEKVGRIEVHDWNKDAAFKLAELGVRLGRTVVIEVSREE